MSGKGTRAGGRNETTPHLKPLFPLPLFHDKKPGGGPEDEELLKQTVKQSKTIVK